MADKDIGVITGLEYSDHYIEDLFHCMFDKYQSMAKRITSLDEARQHAMVDSAYMTDIRDAVHTYCEDMDVIIDDTYLRNFELELDKDPDLAPARTILPELENHRGMSIRSMVVKMSDYIKSNDVKVHETEIAMNDFSDEMNDQYHYYRDSFSAGSREFPVNKNAAACIDNNKELIGHAIDYTFSLFSEDADKAHSKFIKEDLFDYMSGDDLDHIKFMSPIIKACGEPKGSKSIPTVTVTPKPVMLDYPKEEPFFADQDDPYHGLF